MTKEILDSPIELIIRHMKTREERACLEQRIGKVARTPPMEAALKQTTFRQGQSWVVYKKPSNLSYLAILFELIWSTRQRLHG